MPIRKALVYAKAGAMVARYRFVVAVDSLANGVDASLSLGQAISASGDGCGH